MRLIQHAILLFLLLRVPAANALDNTPRAHGLEENKGQVCTTNGEAAPWVRYRMVQGNTRLFLLENGIAYQFSRTHYPAGYQELQSTGHDPEKQEQLEALRSQIRLETFRMDMYLEGANPAARITTEGRSKDYTQYYNHHALDVHTYAKVIYHDVYPGIDWVVYTTEKGMKYDFVVRPGADPNLIRMRFTHHEELRLAGDGGLILGNRMGRITEAPPVSYQEGKEIVTRFVLQGNGLGFATGPYDRAKELIIDPELAWATYYGGSGEDRGWNCATDGNGYVYLAGITPSTEAMAQGGYQNTYGGGGSDAFLVKFNSDGVRQWATYYGGDGEDRGYHCAVDIFGNAYLVGETTSLASIAFNGHQNTSGGSSDAFLVKFDANGDQLWGTYYGGESFESGLYCVTDANGNVYLAGRTGSDTQIAFNGHQNTLSGSSCAFLVKFNANGTRQWGTYYGGTNSTMGRACTVDGGGNVYLAGQTTSPDGIASNGYQNTPGGGYDGFLVKFGTNGTRLWGTYYGGEQGENAWSCTVDANDNVYMAGATDSPSGIASGGHQNIHGGERDGFLVKFSAAGTREWATYYGGNGDDQAFSCAVDDGGAVFLGGFTESQADIASGGFQNTYGGGYSDAFLAKFNSAGVRLWATYYGGEDHEGGDYYWDPNNHFYNYGAVCCAVDGDGNAFLSGSTRSASGIASGGHQNTLGGIRDAFLVKFAGDPGITTGVVSGPFCEGSPVSVPFTVVGNFNGDNLFTAQLSDAAGSFASPVDIGSLSGTSSGTIEATIPAGTATGLGYRIRVIASDPATIGGDNGADIQVTTPGSPCDDGDPETNGDVINAQCVCAGAPACSTVADLQESESNDDYSTADELPVNTAISGSLGNCGVSDPRDMFVITLATAGTLRMDVCMATDGTIPVNVRFQLSISTSYVVDTHELPAGTNDASITGSFEFPCLGAGTYYIQVDADGLTDCLSYAFTNTLLAPVFGNDPFPGPSVAYDTYQDGQVGFFGEPGTSDQFHIQAPMDGRLQLEVQAERTGPEPGGLQVSLYTTTGYIIKEWVVPSGGNGVPETTLVSADCLSEGGSYDVYIAALDCGTSYRWKYTIIPPVFAGDAEPNNSTSDAIVLPASTPGTGHLDFLPQLEGTGDNTDYFRMDLPSDGVLHVNVEAEHGDEAADGMLDVWVMSSTSYTFATWQAPVGALSVPASSSFSLPCMGTTIPYYLYLHSSTCGVSYQVSYTVSPPLYAADAEPNDYYDVGIPMDLGNNWYDGHIGFQNAEDDDHYRFTHAGGPFSVTVSAEHAGADEGTMGLNVMWSTGTIYGTFVVPVGGSSTPLTNTFTIPDLPAGENYSMYLSDTTCGVSYRIHCATDADGDGVCDGADLCPGGPEPGTPCDDGNAATINDMITAACDCAGDIVTGLNPADAPDAILHVRPNPARDQVWIDVGAAAGAPATVMVRDLLGRTVKTWGPVTAGGTGEYAITLHGLAQGTYLLHVQVGGHQWSTRIVKD